MNDTIFKNGLAAKTSTDQNLQADTHPEYRPDIDGLRAIAVLLVIGFHAFPVWVAGGFIGVDIFFVISGFLISTIIFKGLQKDRFSFLDFYARRIKRIFPALVLVLIACIGVGWVCLYPDEYSALGKHVAGGAAFIANILLWQESGYFDTARYAKPLLHLWSLGVEEQFYLIWPLLLATFWKQTHRLLPLLGCIFLLSFTANVLLVHNDPTATYYLPITRFWELMLGSALAYIALFTPHRALIPLKFQSSLSEILSWAGVLMYAVALSFITERRPFPGWWALLPTLGTVFLIAAGPSATINRIGLSSRPMVFVGLISYPLYLWHWPLLSFVRTVGLTSQPARVTAVVTAVVLAWLTYEVVEKPIRFNKRPKTAVGLLIAGTMSACFGLFIYMDHGVESRAINKRSRDTLQFLAASRELNLSLRDKYKSDGCKHLQLDARVKPLCIASGNTNADKIIVWGDSHAWAWAALFAEIAQENNLRAIIFSAPGCPPIVGSRRIDGQATDGGCSDFGSAERFVSAIAALKPKHIYLIADWSLYTNSGIIQTVDEDVDSDEASRTSAFKSQLIKTLQLLTAQAAVTVFRTTPVLLNDVEKGLLRKVPLEPTIEEHRQHEAIANNIIDGARRVFPQVEIFDPASVSCAERCRAIIGNTLLYTDDNHVTAQGSLLFKDRLLQNRLDFLEQQRKPTRQDANRLP